MSARVDESFTRKQNREPGNHLGKTICDVNMVTSQTGKINLCANGIPCMFISNAYEEEGDNYPKREM